MMASPDYSIAEVTHITTYIRATAKNYIMRVYHGQGKTRDASAVMPDVALEQSVQLFSQT